MAARRTLALLLLAAGACALVDDVIEVLKFGKEVGEDILNSWDVIGKPFNASGGVDLPITRRPERKILARLSVIYRAIEKMQAELEKTTAATRYLIRVGQRGTKQDLRLQQMTRLLSKVAAADGRMREYVDLQSDLERSTLEDFVKWCVSHDEGALPDILAEVHALISPPHKHLLGSGLFELILDDVKVSKESVFTDKWSCTPALTIEFNFVGTSPVPGHMKGLFTAKRLLPVDIMFVLSQPEQITDDITRFV